MNTDEKIKKVKQLVGSDSSVIELHDLFASEVRQFLADTHKEVPTPSRTLSSKQFADQISDYEETCNDLMMLTACLAYWAKPDHTYILRKVFARSVDEMVSRGSSMVYNDLRWYPEILLFYCAGVACVDAGRYDFLVEMLNVIISSNGHRQYDLTFVEAIAKAICSISSAFGLLPGYENCDVPMSEYLLKILQPKIDELLFTGKGYESAFDEFEALFALVVDDLQNEQRTICNPVGRFGPNHHSSNNPPLRRIIEGVKTVGDNYGPIRAGLFGRNAERFRELAEKYEQKIARIYT